MQQDMGYQNNCPVGYAARHGVSKQLSCRVRSKTWGIKTIVLQGKPQDMEYQNNCPVGYAARHGVSKQLSCGIRSQTWGIKTIVL